MCLMFLPLAALLFLAGPVMAMTNTEVGWSDHAVNHESSDAPMAVMAQPVALHSDAQAKSGAKDTVLGVYSVLPVMGNASARNESTETIIAKADAIAIGYKDRPCWSM
jgi:hypothetical protein